MTPKYRYVVHIHGILAIIIMADSAHDRPDGTIIFKIGDEVVAVEANVTGLQRTDCIPTSPNQSSTIP